MAHDRLAGRVFDLWASLMFGAGIIRQRFWPLALAAFFVACAALFACLPFSQSSQPKSPQSLVTGAGGSGFSTFGGHSAMAIPSVAAAFDDVKHGLEKEKQAAPSWLGFKKATAGPYQSRSE